MYMYIHTIHVKNNATICKFVHHFLIRNRAALLWFVREAPGFGIAAGFLPNAPHYHDKSTTVQGLRRFTRRCTAARPSKWDAFGGGKVAHMPPCFQVLLRRVCCILF